MTFYKDSYGINHRSAIPKKLRELAQIIAESNYDEALLPHPRKRYCHDDQHLACAMTETTSQERVTEKRICRCWSYFNKADRNQDCSTCNFKFKKKNLGKYEIIDYEVPTEFAMEQLGGIDWLLKKDNRLIATEVKPPNSSETIVRMIAEILTYTVGTSYSPAICFFKTTTDGTPSKQLIDYLKYKDNEDFLQIKERTGLEILYITFDKDTFSIHNVIDEPLGNI